MKFTIKQVVHEFYVIEADSEEEALDILFCGDTDPVRVNCLEREIKTNTQGETV